MSQVSSGKTNMSVSARVIYQLGEQLIKDEFVALTELIKNSYDADATGIKITIDTTCVTNHGYGRIVIEDNGNGMTRDIIFNSFLRISTNFKLIEKFSPIFNRRTLGEKGLGRLAIQRLGNYVSVYSKPKIGEEKLCKIFSNDDLLFHKEFDTTVLQIDWLKFKTSNDDFNNLDVDYNFTNDPTLKFGTKIVIEGIRNLEFWNIGRREINRFRKELFGLVNPFSQNKEVKFNIMLSVDNTIISNEKIDETVLDIMSDISVKFFFENWKIKMTITPKSNYIERLNDGLIKRMRAKGFTKFVRFENKNLIYSDRTFEINIDLTQDKYRIDYPYLREIYLWSDENDKFAYPGNLSGGFYVLSNEREALDDAMYRLTSNQIVFNTQKEVKAIWTAAAGVKLFRDNFRIFPYGEVSTSGAQDWLNFNYRTYTLKSTSYKGHTVAGYVNLDGITSDQTKEQTNRNGLIEDEYGKNLLIVMRDIIAEISVRNDVYLRGLFDTPQISENDTEIKSRDGHTVFYRENNKSDVSKSINEIISDVNRLSNNPEVSQELKAELNQMNTRVGSVINDIERNELSDRQNESIKNQRIMYLENLVGLAGQGMIVESLTHELHRIESNISFLAKESKSDLLKIEVDKGQYKNILEKQELILQQVVFLQQQLEHLEPTYKKNQFKIEQINIKDFLENLYIKNAPMSNKARDKQVEVVVDGAENKSFEIMGNKGALITIFDNIFINSLYWLEKSDVKKIYFFIDSRDRTISIWDTGPGIDKVREYDLFEPDKSSKPGGRGLGLYIVKEMMRYIKGNITLDTSRRNSYGNLFTFVLRFPE